MKKNKPDNQGFTFIEAVVSVAIFIFITLAMLYLYYNYSNIYNYQQVEAKVAGSARTAANELQKTTLQADKIVSSHTFSGHAYSTGQNTLVLEIPSIDSSGNIVSGKYDYVVFYASGTNFYELTGADAASSRPSGLKQLSDSVATITFTCNNANLDLADKIDADLQMQTTTRRQTITYHLHQEIYLRNK